MHSIQVHTVHTVHIVQYTGTYSTVYKYIQYIYVQYTGTYSTCMFSIQVHTVHVCSVYRYRCVSPGGPDKESPPTKIYWTKIPFGGLMLVYIHL